MTDQQFDRDPVEALAEEFMERLRSGEHPSVSEYAANHPDLADEIQALFPTIAALEQAKKSDQTSSSESDFSRQAIPERLGDFHIIREIGRGGMGIVYEARQESLRRRVAVKVLPKMALLDSKHLQRFQREARTAAGLHHTNIVPVFGVGSQDGFHYYVMQYIDGVGLDRVLVSLERNKTAVENNDISSIVHELAMAANSANNIDSRNAGQDQASVVTPLNIASHLSYWNTIAQIGVQVAEALQYAHNKGVLHRDIKPANLIIDAQGVVWVADFGLAKAFEHENVSRTGEILGTPAYMAPEQLRGRTDRLSDIYSLGLTLYELSTLRNAFAETNRARLLERIANEEPHRPRQIRPEIPRDLETIVLKAIAHEPKNRYQSAAELAADLRRFLEDRPIQASRVSTAERCWRWCRRNPVIAGLSATALALLLLVAVTATVGYVRTTGALSREQAQRHRAESANDLAIQVLDKIYERFAIPGNGRTDAKSGNGQRDDLMSKPALSPGTAAALDDLLVFYDRLAEQGDSDTKYLEKIALANRRVGDIRHHLGQLEQAKSAYERAIELYEQLDSSSSEKLHFLERGSVQTELGIIFDRLGDSRKAIALWQSALESFEKAKQDGSAAPEISTATERTQEFLTRRMSTQQLRPGPIGRPFRPPQQPPLETGPPHPYPSRPPF